VAEYTVPAIRGRMGSTTYYQAVMRADELAATVRPAMDFEEFKDVLVSERMQRELSEERVEKHIVPYLTKSADRFFGSIIVLAYEPEVFQFESLSELGVKGLRGAYREVGKNTGALTIAGGMLFALDGQHRLHALRTVINEYKTPRLGIKIEGPYRNEIKNDLLSVIFLEFESVQKARRIFNKVNRYAKPTTRAVNILTSEDDGLAIVARTLAGLDEPGEFGSSVEPPIPRQLSSGDLTVNCENSSLKSAERELLTIEVLHKSVGIISSATGEWQLDEANTIVRPADDDLKAAYEKCCEWWNLLMTQFKPFRAALRQPEEITEFRKHSSNYSVAFRSVGQEAILEGLLTAHRLSRAGAADLVGRLNEIPMSLTSDIWLGVLLGGGEQRARILTKNKRLAGELIAYQLVGPSRFGARRTEELRQAFNVERATYQLRSRELPRPVI